MECNRNYFCCETWLKNNFLDVDLKLLKEKMKKKLRICIYRLDLITSRLSLNIQEGLKIDSLINTLFNKHIFYTDKFKLVHTQLEFWYSKKSFILKIFQKYVLPCSPFKPLTCNYVYCVRSNEFPGS